MYYGTQGLKSRSSPRHSWGIFPGVVVKDLTVTRYPEYMECWTTSVGTLGFLSLIRGRPIIKDSWVQTANLRRLHGAFTNAFGCHLAFPGQLKYSNVLWKTVCETWILFVYLTGMTLSYSVPPLRNTLKIHVRSFNDLESMESTWNLGTVNCLRERSLFLDMLRH